jgi:hypothetical protein
VTAARQEIRAALRIDCGDGRETGPGTFTYRRPPRAKYECLRCRTEEGPVTGAAAVKDFVATIRARHAATCTARQTERKAA